MEDLSIINWELHQKIMSKHNKIHKSFTFAQVKFNLEEEYLSKNRRPFSVENIDVRSDKNIIIIESYLGDRLKYFLDINTYFIYSDNPINGDSRIKDEATIYWVIKSFLEYIKKEEEKIDSYKDILKKIIKSNINE
jgi:hypothetical protein